jgi:hypothetical protein
MLCVHDICLCYGSLLETNCFKPAKPAMKRPGIHLKDVTTPARRGSQRVHYARRVSSQEGNETLCLFSLDVRLSSQGNAPLYERRTKALKKKSEKFVLRGGDTPASAR